jgi:hypothetical protein
VFQAIDVVITGSSPEMNDARRIKFAEKLSEAAEKRDSIRRPGVAVRFPKKGRTSDAAGWGNDPEELDWQRHNPQLRSAVVGETSPVADEPRTARINDESGFR